MLSKVNTALSLGKLIGAKKLLEEYYKKEAHSNWLKDRKEEYDKLFPKYRSETDIEFEEREVANGIKDKDGNYISDMRLTNILIEIDYSGSEDYKTFNEWLKETKVVKEATLDDNGNVIEPEVTELVRPYIEVDVSDKVDGYLKSKYKELRKKEYPPIEDYLDAVVKGDEEAIEEYKNKCLAVKAKYPKV